MTSLTMKLTIAAAALFAAGAVSAQTMTADIPFAFQAGGKVMAAGTYRVDLGSNVGLVMIRGTRREGAVLVQPITHIDRREATAKLVFVCGRGPCSLLQVWSAYSEKGLLFLTPKLDRNEEASLTVIHLRPDAAD